MGPKSRFSGKPMRGRPGRGRGRGGNARNFGRRPKFDSERVASKEQATENEQPQEGLESEDEADGTDQAGSEDDEREAQSTTRPYMALMMSFAESAPPKAKRRKLDHSETQIRHEPESPAAEEDPQDDADLVDVPEDDEDDIADDRSDDDEEQTDLSDPFETNFVEPNEDSITERLKAIKNNEWAVKKVASASSRTILTLPKLGTDDSSPLPNYSGPSELKLKSKLREEISSKRPKFDPLEQRVSSLLFQYYDTLFCERTVQNAESLRRLACLHAVNHIFKTRDRVLKNNAKAAREDGNEDLDLRDQGFTRPKVLILLPTRQSCVKWVDMICSLCRPDQQENRKRFDDSYIDKDVKFSDDKPADFRDLFEGNDDDMFRLGLKFTRKTIKYFAQFYQSDIIFASPLGLRMAIGSEEEKKTKKVDFDFLSSIEMVIVDQADALLMQNWDHVDYIFEHLNMQPKEAHGCDFSRVRSWYLDINAKYFRQNIIFSAFNTPELSELVRSHCPNWRGKARVQPEYPGVIGQLGVRAKQTFSRFDPSSVEDDPDTRFAYFTKAVVPSLVKRAKDSTGTLIFIPSYLDFVRVRNYFATSTAVANLSFGTISEYAEASEASRARSHFISGRHRILLYTERAHHFRRYQLRGVRSVIMYGLPDNPLFYKEMTGGYLGKSEEDLKLEPGQGSVRVMFSKYDVVKLERIVGSQRVGKMIRERSDTFVFEEEKAR